MKEFIKTSLQESMVFHLLEALVDEDYPNSWSLDEFKKLTSFKRRIKYCQDNLKRISSGTSRIVYKVDDTKVLKLAKNKKGLAQNEIEANYSNYYDINDVLAKVFEYDEDNLWIEMELARKVTPQIFQQVVGFTFEDYSRALMNHYIDVNPQKAYRHKHDINPETVKRMWEDEFVYAMFSFIGNYDIPVGDLMKLNSYGLVNRNGSDQIVMIDYGLDNSVYTSYYS